MEPAEDVHDGSLKPTRLRSWLNRFALVPFFPWLLLAIKFSRLDDTIVRQHDNLDGYRAILERMSWSDLFAAPGTDLPYLLGGVPREFFGSEFFVGNIIGVALPLLLSLFVSEFIIRTVAFYAMRTLLVTVGISDYKLVTYGAATIFALLPFYTPAFAAVAAAPLLLAALLRTLEKQRLDRMSIAVFGLFPLVAPAYATIPYLAVLMVVLIAFIPRYRAGVRPALLGIGIYTLAVLIADWRLIYASQFGPVSHRAVQGGAPRLGWAIATDAGESLFAEVDHVPLGKSQLLVLVFIFAAALLTVGWRRIDQRRRWFILGTAAALLVAAVAAQLWRPFEVGVLARVFDGWGRFQMERVRWIEPTAIYLLFALSLTVIADLVDWGRARRWLSVMVIAAVLLLQGWIVVSMQRFIEAPRSLTVREFYAPDTMLDVKQAVEADEGELVVSVGLHPAVAIANGINSADGYASAYPLEYKQRFRELIAPALEAMNPKDRGYFDNWGSRAYVFQPGVSRPSFSGPSASDGPIEFVVDRSAFDPLDITHVITSTPFTNADELGLRLVLETGFEDELGPIWLYRVE